MRSDARPFEYGEHILPHLQHPVQDQRDKWYPKPGSHPSTDITLMNDIIFKKIPEWDHRIIKLIKIIKNFVDMEWINTAR